MSFSQYTSDTSDAHSEEGTDQTADRLVPDVEPGTDSERTGKDIGEATASNEQKVTLEQIRTIRSYTNSCLIVLKWRRNIMQ